MLICIYLYMYMRAQWKLHLFEGIMRCNLQCPAQYTTLRINKNMFVFVVVVVKLWRWNVYSLQEFWSFVNYTCLFLQRWLSHYTVLFNGVSLLHIEFIWLAFPSLKGMFCLWEFVTGILAVEHFMNFAFEIRVCMELRSLPSIVWYGFHGNSAISSMSPPS